MMLYDCVIMSYSFNVAEAEYQLSLLQLCFVFKTKQVIEKEE